MRARPRVFVTDASYPHALAAIRALGKAGFAVTAAERENVPAYEVVGFWSRYCSGRVRYPDPRGDDQRTAAALAQHFAAAEYDVVLPVGLEMTSLFVRHRDALDAPVMLPADDAFAVAADKRRTFALAESLGMPVPRTVPLEAWREIPLPVVFKHLRKGASIAVTATEAERIATSLQKKRDEYVVQEFIPGENGFGYFGFFENGVEQAYFMHERLMQIPKEGGPSVVARSVRDEELHRLGKTLLETLRWNGVAMVEFKRSDRDGRFYLMEVNPKFWGSLDLAIQSGCNFPAWVADAVLHREPLRFFGYDENLTYQFVIPNGLKCFLRYPDFRKRFLHNAVSKDVRTDMRLDDPFPAAAGLFSMAMNAVTQ
ncbi:MAG: ATP-grasp domain-containing protein [Candidatus Eremiobacteraeota bacterium]|nr:ATP-grasp domain-containing protein [Candidatus Eremiobacteraeota bacterium]